MRTFFLAMMAATLPLATPAAAGPATRNFGITSFDRVRIEGPYRVRLKTGVAPFARASGSPTALDRVSIEMRGSTLVVHAALMAEGAYPNQSAGPVEIELGTHDLGGAALAGSGSLSIDQAKGLKFDLSVQGSGMADIGSAKIDQLTVNLGGSAAARIAGMAPMLTAVLRGMTVLDASGLSVKDASFGAEGPATIRADVTDSVKIDGSGAATSTLR